MSVASVIKHAKRMHRIMSCMAITIVVFFFPHLINCTIFGKTLLNVKCVLIFATSYA
jgi:hypothetical protein